MKLEESSSNWRKSSVFTQYNSKTEGQSAPAVHIQVLFVQVLLSKQLWYITSKLIKVAILDQRLIRLNTVPRFTTNSANRIEMAYPWTETPGRNLA